MASALALGGVPHPTGYPLYMLLARPFLWLVNDPARALNLASAFWGAVTAGLVGLVVYRLAEVVRRTLSEGAIAEAVVEGGESAVLPPTPGGVRWVGLAGGLLAGLSLAFAPLVWSQAVIAEVYSFNAALTALFWLVLVGWWESAPERKAGAMAMVSLVAGLAVGHHRTAILSVVAALVFVVWVGRGVGGLSKGSGDRKWRWSWLAIGVGLFGLGLFGPYIYLLARGGVEPASNWSNVGLNNLAGLWQHFSGDEYRYLLFSVPLNQSFGRLGTAINIVLSQFGLIGVGLGWGGLALLWLREELQPLAGLAGLNVALPIGFFMIYGADNAEVYLIPALLAWAILMGVGLVGGVAWLWATYPRRVRLIGVGVLALVLLMPTVSLVSNWHSLDLSSDRAAESWAKTQLEAAPSQAILLSDTDATTFALWYSEYVRHDRPDVTVVEVRLLRYDWYRQNLNRLYPYLITSPQMASTATGNIELSARQIRAANSTRPVVVVSRSLGVGSASFSRLAAKLLY